jgi:hypothetical protein
VRLEEVRRTFEKGKVDPLPVLIGAEIGRSTGSGEACLVLVYVSEQRNATEVLIEEQNGRETALALGSEGLRESRRGNGANPGYG